MRHWRSVVAWGLFVALTSCAPHGLPAVPPAAGRTTPPPQIAFSTPQPVSAQVLRYALAPFPGPMDPHWRCSPQLGVLLNTVYETLVYLNDDYFFEPSLAESWEAAPDAATYTFKLRAGVLFHDGTAFTAAAVRQNFDRIASAADTQGGPALLPGYLGTDELDRYTVRIRFDRPYPTFLDELSRVCLALLSPASFDRSGALKTVHPAGTGPFLFADGDSQPDSTLVLVRNESYRWGPAAYRRLGARYSGGSGEDHDGPCRRGSWASEHTGPAFLEKVTFQFMADAAERATALEAGQVDAAEDLLPADAERLRRSGHFWIFTVPRPPSDGATTDKVLLRRRRMNIEQLTPADLLANPDSAQVLFNSARREVNCLAFGVHAWNPNLYDTSIRAES